MLRPFLKLLSDKATHYGRSGIGFVHLTLVIYYGQAVIYNSPAETADFKFEDLVQIARRFVTRIEHPFNSIFLFIALNDGRVLRVV
jgi:hypothetical protein